MAAPDTDSDKLGGLMRAAQLGDSRAYTDLLRALTPKIRGIVAARRGFAGAEEVEDLVQEVLLSLHQVRASYDPLRPFMPWVAAIVRNRLADGARRYARTTSREISMEESDVTFSEPTANNDSGGPVDADLLRDAVRSLSQKQRRAIELLKLEERSLKEVASMTGSSESSLKVATHRAIEALRRKLGAR